jgi:hypothetical protein
MPGNIRTRPTTIEYRSGWDRIFNKKETDDNNSKEGMVKNGKAQKDGKHI